MVRLPFAGCPVHSIPAQKRIRLVIHTDCKNEADDQFALAHAMLISRFDVKGIVAGHFEIKPDEGQGLSMKKSYDEVNLVLRLRGLEGTVPVYKGAERAMPDEATPRPSEGADFILKEAMAEDPLPLYVIFLGSLTDMASALLQEAMERYMGIEVYRHEGP